MASIVTTAKFIDPIFIDTENVYMATRVTNLIASLEPSIIRTVLGEEAEEWIYANVEETDLNTFYNGGFYVNGSGKSIKTDGIVTMLANFLYFYVAQKVELITTSVGTVTNNENRNDSVKNTNCIDAWNEGVRISATINDYVIANPTLFESSNVNVSILDKLNTFCI